MTQLQFDDLDQAKPASPAPAWKPQPAFIPAPRSCYMCPGPKTTLVIEPAIEHPGFYFVSNLDTETGAYDCTRRPVRADWVEEYLILYGMSNPGAAEWRVRASSGVRAPLETLTGVCA